ncbi:MAG: ferredoxin [Deltaproteobacteria bacterium]|nr:ferredoxin [Deltaproteobacteria bacterium]
MDIAPSPATKTVPLVDADLCTGCAACADECDPACLVMDGGLAVLIEPEACTSCEDCVPVCEVEGAIKMGAAS